MEQSAVASAVVGSTQSASTYKEYLRSQFIYKEFRDLDLHSFPALVSQIPFLSYLILIVPFCFSQKLTTPTDRKPICANSTSWRVMSACLGPTIAYMRTVLRTYKSKTRISYGAWRQRNAKLSSTI